MRRSPIGMLAWIVSGLTAAPALYLLVVTTVALLPRRTSRPRTNPATRFVVCVPAHDEERVVGQTIRSLTEQNYPRSLYSVHVVADNCTDATAQIAADAGASVHVRNDAQNPGKGAALNWLAQRVLGPDIDALVVVDADTVAEPGMLAAFDATFARGAKVLQGQYAVKDQSTSTSVALRSAALACRHHLRPLGRRRLGASCGLFGNGMAFRPGIVRRHPWSNHLVEDAELQLELLLDGQLVEYVPEAVVRAEMPDSPTAAVSQNERWELGRMQLQRRFVPALLGRTVMGGPVTRVAYADAALDVALPPLSVLAALDLAAASAGGALMVLTRRNGGLALLAAGIGSGAVLVVHVLAALKSVGAPREVYRSFRHAPQLVLWKLRLITRVAHRPGPVAWTRTRRNEMGAVA